MPAKNKLKYTCKFILVVSAIIFYNCTLVFAQREQNSEPLVLLPSQQVTSGAQPDPSVLNGTGEDDIWLSFKAGKISLYYKPTVDIKRLEKRLRRRYLPVSGSMKDMFSNPLYDVETRVSARLQAILSRVEDVLAMHPSNLRINLRVFKKRSELSEQYYNIFKEKKNYLSFYIHRFASIYSSEQDILDSIIAHEMAHAVVDHYFNTIPPAKVAELLANYVDLHLEQN